MKDSGAAQIQSRRARAVTLRSAGAVAVLAAGHQVLTGARGVRGPRIADSGIDLRNVDSELRFYAAWYAVAGVLMHRAAADRSVDAQVAPVLAGGWALAAAARLIGMRAVGRPDRLFVVLTGLEAGLAAVLVATRPAAAG